MNGYIDNKTRVLNEWYNLFNKDRILSLKELKHWDYIKQYGLQNFKHDCCNYFAIENFLKYNFIFSNNLILNSDTYHELSLSINCHKLVFLNGKFLPLFSDTEIDPWILNFDNSSNRYDISKPICPNIFLYLTECLSNSLIKITLPEKSIIKKPLYLLHISSGSNISNQLVTSHYYYNVNIEKDNDAYIIEHFVSINKHAHFSGSRILMSIDDRSKLNHLKLIFENQNSYHISHHDINLKKFSHINSNAFIIFGPQFVRHQVNSKINHVQSSLSVNSLSYLSKQDICDIGTYVEHNNPDHAISTQLHKIIAKDHSTGIFNGLIKVNKESCDTDAKMVNKNLLLNQTSSIYSSPKLEIYSDAVQCGHGSTIGHIDNNALFYLNTRGITQADALKILIYAFSEEVIKKIKDSLLQNFIIKKINYDLIRRK